MNLHIKTPSISSWVMLGTYLVLLCLSGTEARDKGEDIIMTKGKLIMRGGKGKGNIILDTGSKSSDHEMMPMFNPFAFYPMQHHQQPQPMMIHPVYVEDHSALHKNEPEYQHQEEPKHYHQQQEMEYQHEEPHQGNHEEEQHQMGGNHYGHESQSEDEGHHYGGYETHPIMSMMMHGSRMEPSYNQMIAMQAYQHPVMFAHNNLHQQALQHQMQQQHFQALQQHQLQQQQQQQQANEKQEQYNGQKNQEVSSSASNQQSSIGGKPDASSSNATRTNPLMAIIKPLFKRNVNKQKKP